MGLDVHPRSRDLDQPGVYEHLHARAFKGPRQPTKVAVPGRVIAGDGHRIAVEFLYHL